ncbi:hypothetical protein ISS04_04480 [Candidatus Woesearchaeota archaeon]|nr:hypothetical protein [Candidatus Woesearchaeota archaeon]
MPQNLIDYINQQLSQGYSIQQIRQALLNYGYATYQIEQAIKQTYNQQPQQQPQTWPGRVQPIQQPQQIQQPYPQQQPQQQPYPQQQPQQTTQPTTAQPKTGIPKQLLVFLILIIAVTGTIYFGYSKLIKPHQAPETLLDVSLEPISTTAQPEEKISFIQTLESMGTKKRYDVTVMYTLQDLEENVIQTPTEKTIALETKSTKKIEILIEKDTEPGSYSLKAVVKYNGQTATASIPVKIYKESKQEPTCTDNLKNQGEENIDCGGPCEECGACPTTCDDQDACTEDLPCSAETNYICKHVEIQGCRESYLEEQTQVEEPITFTTSTENVYLEDIQDQLPDLISSNPSEAAQLCGQLTNQIEKDNCFSTIVEHTQDSQFCQYVTRETTKDSCYFSVVLKTNNYKLCNELTTPHFQRSCDSFQQVQSMIGEMENPPEPDYSGIEQLKQSILEGKTPDEILAMMGITNPNINDYNLVDQLITAVHEGKSNEEIAQLLI